MPAQYSTNEPGFVYLIHLHRPLNRGIARDKRTVKHYLGWCKDLSARIQSHERGSGSKFMACARRIGISFDVVRVWKGSPKFEKQLKARKKAADFCPICSNIRQRELFELSPAQIQDALIGF